jgi:FtsP/CotA-like multicopper oxidase with cupredoxin domain
LAAFIKQLAALEGQPQAAPNTFRGVATLLASQMNAMQAADVAPTANTLAAVTAALRAGDDVMARWAALLSKDLPALNATLKAAGLPVITGPGSGRRGVSQ